MCFHGIVWWDENHKKIRFGLYFSISNAAGCWVTLFGLWRRCARKKAEQSCRGGEEMPFPATALQRVCHLATLPAPSQSLILEGHLSRAARQAWLISLKVTEKLWSVVAMSSEGDGGNRGNPTTQPLLLSCQFLSTEILALVANRLLPRSSEGRQ